MAQEYVLLNEKGATGEIALSKNVFELIADITLDDVDSVERIPANKFSKAISCKIVNNQLHIAIDVKLKYGANVNATCEILQNRIYQNIYDMTNMKCGSVDIHVVGFHI
ncbi:Asp23/Gls24 family envelope stress response protein [Anaerorhabdus sp.]|uniref:Asp23/Gls24 family envelope stress response protein n=1 Tax=Anaerorhabdus sp. TaxID=1872524 RepID=UPI002FC745CB